jgi:hypothetical protein
MIPLPASAVAQDLDTADVPSVLQRLSALIRLLDLFRLQNGVELDKTIRLLVRRLVRIRSLFKKITPATKTGI